MLAGMLLGLGASASWALANVAVQRAGRAVGALRALFWAQVLGIAMSLLGALAIGGRLPALTAADGGWLVVAARLRPGGVRAASSTPSSTAA